MVDRELHQLLEKVDADLAQEACAKGLSALLPGKAASGRLRSQTSRWPAMGAAL